MNLAKAENLVTMREVGGDVIPFPSPEAAKEVAEEVKTRKEVGKERAAALRPYFRQWIKKTIGRDAAAKYRSGEPFSVEISINWILEHVCNPTTLKVFALAIEKEKDRNGNLQVAPEVPKNINAWDVMRAVMLCLRGYNYGMAQVNSGYMLDCDSDHVPRQAMNTGEYVWSEPTKLTFKLWRVVNGDYETPWKLEWVTNPANPAEKIQIKVYTKVASVLKPWEKDKKAEPEMDDDRANSLRLAALNEGEYAEFTFQGDHESEVEQDKEDFRGLVTRISEANNARFSWIEPEQNRVQIYHQGKLYR